MGGRKKGERDLVEEARKLNDDGVYNLMRHLIHVAKKDLVTAKANLDYWEPQYFRMFGKDPKDYYKEQIFESNPFARTVDTQYNYAVMSYENTIAFFDSSLFRQFCRMPGHEYARRLLSGEFKSTVSDEEDN